MQEILLQDNNKSKRLKYAINLWSRCPLAGNYDLERSVGRSIGLERFRGLGNVSLAMYVRVLNLFAR